jgi:hypothetical protein
MSSQESFERSFKEVTDRISSATMVNGEVCPEKGNKTKKFPSIVVENLFSFLVFSLDNILTPPDRMMYRN